MTAGRRHPVTANRVELVAIGLFTLFIVWPFMQRSQLVVSFDGLAYSGPNLEVTFEALRHGELPLWNRMIFGGVSHAGNPQVGFWYPALALGLPFSTTRALNVLSLVHLLLFAGGMVALCRWRLRLRPPATFVGTAVALGCGAMASKSIQFEQLLVVAWVPLLLALLHWLVTGDDRRRWRAAGCVALATAAWLSAGHPHTGFLTAPVLLVWTVAVAADTRCWRRLGWVAAAAAGGALIALPHLWLAWQATDASALDGGRTFAAVRAVGWLQGRAMVPGLFGNPSALDPASLTHDFEATTYIGVAAAVLAVAGLVTGAMIARRRIATLGLGGLGALCLVLATGPATPLFRFAFERVPGFDLGRVTARWVLPASLCIAVLAAWGADAARDASRRQRRAVLIAIAALGIVAAAAALAYPDQVPGRRVAGTWVLVGAATTLAWVWRPRSARLAAACLVVPALLVAGELGIAARHSFARIVSVPNAPESATGPGLTFFEEHPEGRTIALTFDDLGNPTYLAPGLRPNVNATFGIPSVDGYDGGVQVTDRWAAVYGAQLPDFDPALTLRSQIQVPLDPTTWARLGLRYALVDPRGDAVDALLPGWAGPVVTGDLEVYENPAWRGDAVVWHSTLPVVSLEEAAGLLLADPLGDSAYVETEAEPLVCVAVDCSPTGVGAERPSPGTIVVRPELAEAGLVVVSEQFDDGWSVTVDGSSAEVVAVDGIQIGVMVPAGAHEVRFTYRPSGLTLTIVLSLLAALAAIAAIAIPTQRQRSRARSWRSDPPNAPEIAASGG